MEISYVVQYDLNEIQNVDHVATHYVVCVFTNVL